jgi:Reverse transcriptase (RNA-dependent DNA polymerase).
LYAKVKARPILAEKHRVWIKMADGLKQGCPLSPVFFAVVMDPLLYCLKQIHQVEPLGFADDLSVIYPEVGSGKAIAQTIDTYSRVAGPLVNFTKTVILCTLGDGENALDELPLTWNAVKCSEFERYLGTFVGRGVDVNKVFMQAWDKMTNRLRQYTPVKHTFNLQGRVDIANSFLLPLFSFLFRFYMMTQSFMDDVEKAIANLMGGPQQPLSVRPPHYLTGGGWYSPSLALNLPYQHRYSPEENKRPAHSGRVRV